MKREGGEESREDGGERPGGASHHRIGPLLEFRRGCRRIRAEGIIAEMKALRATWYDHGGGPARRRPAAASRGWSMARLKADGPIVEMTGDEMAQHVWELVRDRCVLEWIDLPLETYDLCIASREATEDEVTRRAAEAVIEHGVAVKCSTITPDEEGVRKHGLSRAWPSPNVTIRNRLEGTIFRKPVLVPSVPPRVRNWKKPIIVGRHAFGDLFRCEEYHVASPGKTRMTYTPDDRDGWTKTVELFTFDSPGVIMACTTRRPRCGPSPRHAWTTPSP